MDVEGWDVITRYRAPKVDKLSPIYGRSIHAHALVGRMHMTNLRIHHLV